MRRPKLPVALLQKATHDRWQICRLKSWCIFFCAHSIQCFCAHRCAKPSRHKSMLLVLVGRGISAGGARPASRATNWFCPVCVSSYFVAFSRLIDACLGHGSHPTEGSPSICPWSQIQIAISKGFYSSAVTRFRSSCGLLFCQISGIPQDWIKTFRQLILTG